MRLETQKQVLCTLAAKKRLFGAFLFSGNDASIREELIYELLELLSIGSADRIHVQPEKEEGTSAITIAQLRELSSFLSMSPWSSFGKAAIVKEAHCMNREAQSAFLKLLEEPKGRVVFFLVSEYPDMLLPTVRSRVQEFKFYAFAPVEAQEGIMGEFEKLRKADLQERFSFAKRLAEVPEQIEQKLQEWLADSRQLLHRATREDISGALGLLSTIKVIQETSLLIRTTQVNRRLALERLFLHF